jgi:hypothetical protein
MTPVKAFGLFFVVLGLLAAGVSFVAAGPYAARSGTYQLVKESETAALFGDAGEPIGTPQVYVVSDPSFVLDQEDGEGVRQLSLTRMEKAGSYPLQFKSVEAVLGYVRAGGIGVLLLGLVLTALPAWRTRKAVPA